jgi:hypothetical protein
MPRLTLLTALMTSLFTICVACSSTQTLPSAADGDGLRGAYADSAYLAPFGSHNHYYDGWRTYEETVSARRFNNGIGATMPRPNLGYPPEEVARMLAEHGITRGRLEIPWGKLSMDENSKDLAEFDATLLAMRKHGIRPMILLNAHHGGPNPSVRTGLTVTTDAAQGDRTITVNDASSLKPHYSGPTLDEHAPTMFVTGIDGNQLTLSKPLPVALSSGQSVSFVTLEYRPFSEPGTRAQQETVAGWRKYNSIVAAHIARLYGTRGQKDVGFDLEVWNELTFGSDFLDINHYYDPPLQKNYNSRDAWNYIPQATAQEAEAHPEIYSGATITNGFSNTIPWPASSELPHRLGGLSKHPYPKARDYPADERRSQALDENLQPTDFVPSYHSYYPEYGLSQQRTETLARDGAPFDNDINGVVHGRYAKGKEVPLYLTEINYSPSNAGISDPDTAMDMKAKSALRLYAMYLTKGVASVYLFTAAGHGGEAGLDILTDRFLDHIKSGGGYPANSGEYSGPVMQSIKRLTDEIRRGADMSLDSTRQVKVASITDTHGATQWAGSGSHPPLYDREVFAVLPIQRSTNSFVVPFYVVTRDMRQDYEPKNFTIRLDGVEGKDATVKVLDPLTGQDTYHRMRSSGADYLSVTVEAEDYPRLLSIEEG